MYRDIWHWQLQKLYLAHDINRNTYLTFFIMGLDETVSTTGPSQVLQHLLLYIFAKRMKK